MKPIKIISLAVLCALLLTASLVFAVTREDDSRPYSAEFSRRTRVYTPKETTKKAVTTRHPVTTSSPETTEDTTAAATTAVLPGMKNGAFVCRLTMPKTEWAAGEQPSFRLDFGLTDDSYGEGKLRLCVKCDDLALGKTLEFENYLYDMHAMDGKKAPDSAELTLVRCLTDGSGVKEMTDLPQYAYGKLYLYFEFIPARGNNTFGDNSWYEDEDDDEDYGEIYPDTDNSVWVGGFWCSYAITPCGVRFARREIASYDFFSETLIKQYRRGDMDAGTFCSAYWFAALDGMTYLRATSPISDGKTVLSYYSPTLRAEASRAVSDSEILSLVAENGPYPDEHTDKSISQTRGREMAEYTLGVLRDQGVITYAEYEAELEALHGRSKFVTSPPEFDRRFKKYRKLIEENVFTHE